VDGLAVDGLAVDGLAVDGLAVDGLAVDGLAVDGLAVDGLAVDGLAVDGLAVDGLAVDGCLSSVLKRATSSNELQERLAPTDPRHAHGETPPAPQRYPFLNARCLCPPGPPRAHDWTLASRTSEAARAERPPRRPGPGVFHCRPFSLLFSPSTAWLDGPADASARGPQRNR